jgi:DNA invertase Pin-like site-specific DNA recombinase
VKKRRKSGDPKLAVAYIRVSTRDQDLGPKAQRAEIGRYARAQGIRIARWRVEQISGKAPLAKRLRLARAIRDVKELGAGKLLVWRRDRFVRGDVITVAVIERAIQDHGGELWATDGLSNGDSPDARLLRRILDAVNAYELEMISLRTALAAAARTRQGVYGGGRAPFGQRREGGLLVADEQEQRIVEMVRTMRSTGLRSTAIAGLLNADHVACRGSKWHAKTVRRILARQSRAGGGR